MKGTQANHYVLGVDIGGTHITAGLVDVTRKELVYGSKKRATVNSHGSANTILQVWVDTLRHVIVQSTKRVSHIGIAMPGPFDYENGISLIKGMHKYEALYGVNVRAHLAAHLKLNAPDICFRNDAEAFLAGEVFCGAAMGYDDVIGITLGTGLGSATSHDGVTKDVNLGSSLFLDGIAEDYISSRWFLKRYKEESGNIANDVKQLARMAGTNENVKLLFEEFTTNLSAFLQKFAKDENPEVIVIGGGMAGASKLFLGGLKRTLSKKAEIKISKLGEDASLVGAAAMHMYAAPVSL